jgi:hypothetical protein
MRKPLPAAAMYVALALSGNAIAAPNIESTCSGAESESCAASPAQASETGNDRNVVTQDASASWESFRPDEAVALGRLDQSVSHMSADGVGHAIDNDDVARDNIASGGPALHPSTPDPAAALPTAFAAPRIVLDAAPSLTGGWLNTGQYALSFALTGRN